MRVSSTALTTLKELVVRLFSRPRTFRHKMFFGILYVSAPFLVLYGLYLVDRPYNLDDAYRIEAERFVVSYDDAPPVSGWNHISSSPAPYLADDDPFMSVWYEFGVPTDIETPTLYFPMPYSNLDVWYRGARLLQLGSMALPLYYARYPVLRPLPVAESGTNSNKLYIRVARHSANPYIPDAYVAPYALAQLDFDHQSITRRWISVFMLVAMSIFVIVNLGLFIVNRRETAYGWYALTMLLWGLHTAHGLINDIPFHHPLWFAISYVLILWTVAELIFINRFFSIPAPRVEKFIVVVSIAVSAILLVISLGPRFEPMLQVVRWLITPWALFVAFLIISRYFAAIRQNWNYESVSLWLLSGVFLGVGVRDIFYELNLPGFSPPGSAYYLQVFAALPMALFGLHLLRRYTKALRIARLKNDELDEAVAERTSALEDSYKEIANEQSRRSLAEERARLMRDMHDGLGGQLVHALALSEQGSDPELQKALRLALDDLRLIVESLSPEQRSLPELVASYRHRVAGLLARTGVRVSWEIADLQWREALSPKHALNLLRILQEAVTNAVRHSGAKQIRVVLRDASNGVLLRIADDGRGMDNYRPGRGLENMRTRAREIGMQIDIDSTTDGTVVSCLLTP